MQCFDIAVDDCRQLGEDFEEDKLLSRFMDGLNYKSKVYEGQIESIHSEINMAKLNPTLIPITLQYVQSQLLSINEKRGFTSSNSSIKWYNTGNTYAMPATSNTTTKQRKQQTRTPMNVTCGYKPCGKKGHTTEDC
jgi:hypothetical protein